MRSDRMNCAHPSWVFLDGLNRFSSIDARTSDITHGDDSNGHSMVFWSTTHASAGRDSRSATCWWSTTTGRQDVVHSAAKPPDRDHPCLLAITTILYQQHIFRASCSSFLLQVYARSLALLTEASRFRLCSALRRQRTLVDEYNRSKGHQPTEFLNHVLSPCTSYRATPDAPYMTRCSHHE